MPEAEQDVVGVFTMPREFPCGEGSSCCGPVGQTDEEVSALTSALEAIGARVEVHNVKKVDVLRDHPNVFKLIRTFGAAALPVLTVGGKVVGMGAGPIDKTVNAVKECLAGA
ncbi:MAG: hypothetical protein ACYTKD_09375 [Planctomycetota bacterium]